MRCAGIFIFIFVFTCSYLQLIIDWYNLVFHIRQGNFTGTRLPQYHCGNSYGYGYIDRNQTTIKHNANCVW